MSVSYASYVDVQEVDRAFDRISRAIRERRVDFLFGAGMSAESKVPTGNILAYELLQLMFPKTGTNPPSDEKKRELVAAFQFEALVQAVEQTSGNRRNDLTRALKQLLTEPTFDVSPAHKDFLSVCFSQGSRPALDRIFTTNFDGVLESVLGGSAARITEENVRDLTIARDQGKTPILYLHGTLESDAYQITESDIFAKQFRALHSIFRSALNDAEAFVFVGYSMNDPDFRTLYLDYRDDLAIRGKQLKDTYVVSPVSDNFSYDLARTVWRTRGAVFIPLTAGAFFDRLKRIVEDEEDASSKGKIMKKYGLTDDSAYDDKIRQTAEILKVELVDAVQCLLETRTKTGGAL